MKKLPHEKLREAAKTEADERNYYPCVVAAKDFGAMDDTRYTTEVKLLNAIANEIEKYYDPKPRDPEGNPVHEDMEVDGGVVIHWSVSEDGSWTIFDDDYEEIQCGDKNEPISLPEPKILDADGVEIKVGDTVWGKYSGVEHDVLGFDTCDGLLLVSVRNVKTGSTGGASPNLLTHREPDSLEKLRDDIAGFKAEGTYHGAIDTFLQRCEDRLTAIMERDA